MESGTAISEFQILEHGVHLGQVAISEFQDEFKHT